MPDEERRDGLVVSPGAIVGIVVAVLILIVAIQNSGPVAVEILFWDADVRLIFVILISALLGVGVGAVVRRQMRRR